MGNIYFAICHDCKECVSLDKFSDWCVVKFDADKTRESMFCECKDAIQYIEHDKEWVLYSIFMHSFIALHNGHRIEIAHENSPTIDWHAERNEWRSFFDDYTLVFGRIS